MLMRNCATSYGRWGSETCSCLASIKLHLSWWHLAIWLVLAAVAATLAVQLCLRYNAAAGTDLAPGRILWIGISILFGPLVGPMANPASGDLTCPVLWSSVLGIVVLLSVYPFVFLKREVPPVFAGLCWSGYVCAALAWFASALVSLGFSLS